MSAATRRGARWCPPSRFRCAEPSRPKPSPPGNPKPRTRNLVRFIVPAVQFAKKKAPAVAMCGSAPNAPARPAARPTHHGRVVAPPRRRRRTPPLVFLHSDSAAKLDAVRSEEWAPRPRRRHGRDVRVQGMGLHSLTQQLNLRTFGTQRSR